MTSGKRFGSYEILSHLGAGGMGEVHLARDTRLDRQVAIKVLPPDVVRDPERIARFEREARVLASLNHPNIAGVYGFDESDGARFLVMECVEGEMLSAILQRGALAMDDALDIARQMAEGLEEAHERGIVHRDLKPGNVMVTPEGKVKILDFGLAKALTDDSAMVSDANSPTITANVTRPCVILGTAEETTPTPARSLFGPRGAFFWAGRGFSAAGRGEPTFAMEVFCLRGIGCAAHHFWEVWFYALFAADSAYRSSRRVRGVDARGRPATGLHGPRLSA